ELRRQRQRAGALELASAELRFEFDESRGTPKRVFCKQEIPVGGSVVSSHCPPTLSLTPMQSSSLTLQHSLPHFSLRLKRRLKNILPVRCRPSDGRCGGRALGAMPCPPMLLYVSHARAILLPHSPVPLLLLHSPLPCAHHQMNAVVAELMVLANAAVARKLTR
ncbi:unnamed protein product, partial [Closterium sp. NIES-53]